jgi:hypothetical protein
MHLRHLSQQIPLEHVCESLPQKGRWKAI